MVNKNDYEEGIKDVYIMFLEAFADIDRENRKQSGTKIKEKANKLNESLENANIQDKSEDYKAAFYRGKRAVYCCFLLSDRADYSPSTNQLLDALNAAERCLIRVIETARYNIKADQPGGEKAKLLLKDRSERHTWRNQLNAMETEELIQVMRAWFATFGAKVSKVDSFGFEYFLEGQVDDKKNGPV